jgi:hypothetical protein
MYPTSSTHMMSGKPRIGAEFKKYKEYYAMIYGIEIYVNEILKIPNNRLIPGKYYFLDNLPKVRNYIDESHWILMYGKYIGPGQMYRKSGHEFSDLEYIYISSYNEKSPLNVDIIVVIENECRFTYDPNQPSDRDISLHKKYTKQLKNELDALRAEPVDSPGVIPFIGVDYRKVRDANKNKFNTEHHHSISPVNPIEPQPKLKYTSQSQKMKKSQRKKSQKNKKSSVILESAEI